MALAALVRRLGEALIGAAAPPAPAASFSKAHADALAKLIAGLPVGELLDLIEGRGSVDDALALAQSAAGLIAAAFPPAALAAGEAALALEALQFLLDAAGVGPHPFQISGGVPAAFPPGGGPGAYRGR